MVWLWQGIVYQSSSPVKLKALDEVQMHALQDRQALARREYGQVEMPVPIDALAVVGPRPIAQGKMVLLDERCNARTELADTQAACGRFAIRPRGYKSTMNLPTGSSL